MTKPCNRDDAVFGVSQILDGRETGTPAVAAPIGCTARISEWEVPAAGLFSLVTQGETVFRILDQRVQPDGLIMAEVILEEPRDPAPLPASREMLGTMLGEIIRKIGAQNFTQPAHLGDAAWVGHRLAEILPLSKDHKLRLLQERDPLVVLEQIEQAVLDMGT